MSERLSALRERARERMFRWFARNSGQILCTEPSSPPVEMETQPHDSAALRDSRPCPSCGACV